MKKSKKSYLITLLILIFTSFLILFIQASNKVVSDEADLSEIPLVIGEWKAKNIPVEKKILDILRTKSVLMREYANANNEKVILTLVYYRDNRVELHLPERCSVGQGSEIFERDRINIINKKNNTVINANMMLVKNNLSRQIILYYFQSGDFTTSSYLRLKWHMIINRLTGKANSGGLVKFSAFISDNQKATIERLKQFINQASLMLPKYLL